MRLHSLLGRLILPVAMIGTTALGAAVPAYAAPEPANPGEFWILAPDRVVTTDGRVKSVPFSVRNHGDDEVVGLMIEYDTAASKIDPSVGFVPPVGCGAHSCAVGDMAGNSTRSFSFTVNPTAGLPALGSSFEVSVRDATGRFRHTTKITVVRTERGVDLEAAGIDDITLAPGKSAPIPVAVRNNGNEPVESFLVGLAGATYLSFPNKYSNCTSEPDLTGVVCFFQQTIAPGEVFTVADSTPLSVRADADAPGPADYYLGMYTFGGDAEVDPAVAAAKKSAAGRSGERLKLVPARVGRAAKVNEGELNDWDNATSFVVTVSANPADIVALGGTFAGGIGDTRTIKVGFRNDGPAATTASQMSGFLVAKVSIPSGLSLTKVDPNCAPIADGEPDWDNWGQISGHQYACVTWFGLEKGHEDRFSFTAVINDGENEDEGSLTVDGGAQDPKTDNNTASIEVKVTAGGSGGGLPVTGAPAGLLAGGGVLLLIGGAVAFVLARRRRIVTVVE
ncbi:hypothetical protein [Actinoplanes sp. NPDC026623]|uniref:hypothetical protein n=1 Tax=Actinoplanes sp. NPDC026623 TaxID=3155610 RepID=UPI0033CD54CF